MALAAWQTWARLPNDKLQWLLKLLKTGCDRDIQGKQPECSFRLEDVPEISEIEAINRLLPPTKTSLLKVKRILESADASAKNKVASEAEVKVRAHRLALIASSGLQLLCLHYKNNQTW